MKKILVTLLITLFLAGPVAVDALPRRVKRCYKKVDRRYKRDLKRCRRYRTKRFKKACRKSASKKFMRGRKACRRRYR